MTTISNFFAGLSLFILTTVTVHTYGFGLELKSGTDCDWADIEQKGIDLTSQVFNGAFYLHKGMGIVGTATGDATSWRENVSQDINQAAASNCQSQGGSPYRICSNFSSGRWQFFHSITYVCLSENEYNEALNSGIIKESWLEKTFTQEN
jgi:hypothetical protein